MESEQLLKTAEYEELVKLDGRISDVEIQHLSWLGSQVPDLGTVVEIGSFRGKSICAIGSGVRDAGHDADLVAIDLWTKGKGITASKKYSLEATLQIFHEQVGRIGVTVIEKMMSSVEAVVEWKASGSEAIDLLFVDGTHTYKNVKRDYEMWGPLVRPGGRIAFHDYRAKFPDVDRVVDEIVVPSKLWEEAHVHGRMWSARKRSEIATSGSAPSSS